MTNELLLGRPAKQAHWRIRYERERSLGAPWPLFALLVAFVLGLCVR
jgi:hypothetical protein